MIRPCIKSAELESNKILIFQNEQFLWLTLIIQVNSDKVYLLKMCQSFFSSSTNCSSKKPLKLFILMQKPTWCLGRMYLFIRQNRSHVNTNSCSAVTYTDYCQLGGRDFKEGILYTTLFDHIFSTFQLMLGEVSLKISWTLLKLFSIKKCKMLF